MSNKKDDPNFFSQWLEKMQQESWQLELLISGLALYGILEFRTMLDVIDTWVDMNTFDFSRFFGSLGVSFLDMAWTIGAINLFAHIFLRGLWIGAIGLRYVSGDIDYDSLGYSRKFSTYFMRKIGSYDDFMERLEKICSMMFAYTFLLFFIFLSWNLFLVPIVLPLMLIDIDPSQPDTTYFMYSLYVVIYLVFGAIVFIDFVTGGRFKKIRDNSFSRLYLPLYRFFATITLSFIYRPILYNFLDNSYSRRWFFFSIPYILMVWLVIPNFSMRSHSYFPLRGQAVASGEFYSSCYYMDQRIAAFEMKALANSGLDCRSTVPMLTAFENEGPYLEFFLPYSTGDDSRLAAIEGVEPLQSKGVVSKMQFDGSNLSNNIDPDAATIVALEAEYEAHRDSLTTLRKRVSKEYSRKSPEVAALDSLISQSRKDFESRAEQFKADNLTNIREAILSTYRIKINGEVVDGEISSFFHIHPLLKTKGLRCFLRIDDLPLGIHQISLAEERSERVIKINTDGNSVEEKVYSEDISIPFMKSTHASESADGIGPKTPTKSSLGEGSGSISDQ